MLQIHKTVNSLFNPWNAQALLTFGRTHMLNVAHLALSTGCDFHVILCALAIGHLMTNNNYFQLLFSSL